jgi:hypothetical protein
MPRTGLTEYYQAAKNVTIKRRFVPSKGYRFIVKSKGKVVATTKTRSLAESHRKKAIMELL